MPRRAWPWAVSRRSPGARGKPEAALVGKSPSALHFRAAAEAALAEARPSGDNGFKIELARRIVTRALTLAAAGTPERVPALPGSPFAPIPEGVLHG